MDKDSTNKFEEQLKSHAEKMRDIYEHCESEEQTKISMINPFIELLEYDVRDPRVVKLEYPVSARAGTRVDYAIFCTDNDGSADTPTILIEAKAAPNDLAHAQLFRQISDYANLASSVEFVALTNGRLWKWFRKEKDSYGHRKLSHEAFLSHDLLTPHTRNSPEVKFLKKLSSKSFTPDSAQQAADEVRFSEGILRFLESIIDSSPEEIRKLLFKQWGINRNRRDVELFEQVWPKCVETFIESQARKMQLDELLKLERQGIQQGETQSSENELGSAEQENRVDRSRTFNTDGGTVSIHPSFMKRAWKPSKSENWNIESNGLKVLVVVIKHLSTLDSRGAKQFLEECAQNTTFIKHGSEFIDEGSVKKDWRECNEGYLVHTNLPNRDKIAHIKQATKFVHNSEDRDENGELVHLWLPDLDPKT